MAGSDPTVEVSGSRKGVTILGAVSHEGESFYMWSEEKLTADHGITFLRALEAEFDGNIVVLLDQAPYFYAKDLWEHVSGKRTTEFVDETSVERVVGETLQVWYFPPHSPELNPVEQCWNQLDAWFNLKLVRSLEDLKTMLQTGFKTISPPKFSNYLCP
jgi:transposase